MCRQYLGEWVARKVAPEEFKRSCSGRSSNRYVPYHAELGAYPPFLEWLFREVSMATDRGERIKADVLESSRLPEKRATAYRAMWAHRMHLRVQTAEGERVTTDCGVAATFEKHDSNGTVGAVTKVEFVGTVEEITKVIVLWYFCANG